MFASIACLHSFPIIVIIYSISVTSGQDSGILQIHGSISRRKTYLVLLVMLFLSLVIIYGVSYYKTSVINMLKNVYSMQEHAMPFEYHLKLINEYYKKVIAGLYLVGFCIVCGFAYFMSRTSFPGTRWLRLYHWLSQRIWVRLLPCWSFSGSPLF